MSNYDDGLLEAGAYVYYIPDRPWMIWVWIPGERPYGPDNERYRDEPEVTH